MNIHLRIKRKVFGAVALLLIAISLVYYYRLEALAWWYWHAYKPQSTENSLHLKNYQVELDGVPLDKLENTSGLTFDSDSQTLFTVLNKESQIVEFDTKGKVLRVINVKGAADMEGITHIADDRYVVADERDNRLVEVTLPRDATTVDITRAKKINLGINPAGNKNFEGVSWDDNHNRLLVAKERDPKYIMSVTGFFNVSDEAPLNIEIKKIDAFDRAIKWSLRDLSSVTFHSGTGHLLLLSDESRLVKEYDEDGHALGALALWKGFHGLKATVPQAEGIAVGDDGRLYIMSEPNLLYVFKPANK